MFNIFTKIKGDKAPITKDSANMLAFTGKVCTVEERVNEFINDVNESIVAKSRVSQFNTMIELPEELVNQMSIIKQNFVDRGFTIHELEPKLKGTFVISWT